MSLLILPVLTIFNDLVEKYENIVTSATDVSCTTDITSKKFAVKMKYAKENGFSHVCIICSDTRTSDIVYINNLSTGRQKQYNEQEFLTFLYTIDVE